ncbi:MAG: 2-dehydro-3-deoxy-6-phosphogalactonate aldolase [Halioglobus sp.]
MNEKLEQWFTRMPVVAILRGVRPDEVVAMGEALYLAGIGIIEVPLNSPDPLESISRLSQAMSSRCVVGAGTVVQLDQVDGVAAAGGEISVTPNTNPAIIRRSIELGLTPMPGWATASEAFAAYDAGARFLKLFPAGSYDIGHIKSVRAVLPKDSRVLAVGGVGAGNADAWFKAGADGLGVATELYAPGRSADEVFEAANKLVASVKLAAGV